MSHKRVYFLNTDFNAFESKKVMLERAWLGFKRHILSNSFQSSKPISLKNSYLKKLHVTGGGGQKSVTYFLMAPNGDQVSIF